MEQQGIVRVRSGRRAFVMEPGDQLTVGRGSDRDLRVGHEPADDWVSRAAAEVHALADGVLLRNTSRTQPLLLRPLPGPEVTVAPLSGVVRHVPELLQLVVPGRHGAEYVVTVDSRAVVPAADPAPKTLDWQLGTRVAPSKLTERERSVLLALCEPLLTLAGEEARPATYAEIGERLGLANKTVRNCLDALRRRLSEEDGVPGLRGDGEGDTREATSYLPRLAQWAVATGAVSREGLRALDG